MRDNKGKLITVWVPGNHGAGGSTVANSVGITLQHLTEKKTLIVNMGSSKNLMEQYMKNDVDIRFSMDYLRSFDTNLRAEHIKIYATSVNEGLYILPNCKLSTEISKVREDFYDKFLDLALQIFEIVVVDVESGWNKSNQLYLEKADLILAVMNENEIMLEELLQSNGAAKPLLNNEKTLPVFNGLRGMRNEARILKRLNKRLGINDSCGISFDMDAYRAACCQGKFYSFLKRELNKNKSEISLSEEVKELCYVIASRLQIQNEEPQEKASLVSMLFAKAKQWGEIDA